VIAPADEMLFAIAANRGMATPARRTGRAAPLATLCVDA